MKHTLGLDIGTNSLGWVLLEDSKIIDKGVNIFPIGTNLINGIQEDSKNQQRGGYRRTKRNLFRYKLRRKELKKLLKVYNCLPDFSKFHNVKDEYQASVLYKMRADALDTKIPKEEIGRIFLLINKYRGFKSNSNLQLDSNKDEEGKVKEGISQLKGFMQANNARTVGEYFHKMYEKAKALYDDGKWHNIDEPFDERAIDQNGNFIQHNNRGIRRENGRYTERAMYENEFDLIWKEQKKHYPELTGSKEEYDLILQKPVKEKREKLNDFKNTAYWKIKYATIFYQRALRSQKKFIGKCQFETNKRTAPVSSLLFQEFRVWKQLADLRFTNEEEDIHNAPLPKEWKQKIADYLEIHPKLSLRSNKGTDVLDVIGIKNKKKYHFNFDNNEDDKSFNGNRTLSSIYSACGEQVYKKLIEKGKLDKLWHILYMAKDDIWLRDTLISTWEFENDIVNNLAETALEDGFASYSSKVLQKILPFMKEGRDEYDALILTGYMQAPDEVKKEAILNKTIKPLRNNELRNPVSEKAIGQTIKLVNNLLTCEKYSIDRENFAIHIESTREFKKPKKEREKIRRGNTEIDKKREEYAKFLNEQRRENKLSFSRIIYKHDSIIPKFELWLEMGMDKNDEAFKNFEIEKNGAEKHRLWLECNRICPYTGRVISLSKLFSPDIEIEHIIPYSRSLDDSSVNKTITFCEVNKEKGNLTAYEYLKGKGEQAFRDFKQRISNFSKAKKEKFLLDKVPSDFTNAQITNTSYIAKFVIKKLLEVCNDVQFTNGAATAELRKNDWKLGSLLDKIRYEEETGIDIDIYQTEFNLFRKDFEVWRKKKANSIDLPYINWKNLNPEMTAQYEAENNNPLYEWWQEIQKFEDFRSKNGKKDRSDHRHHLLDAIITACCTRSTIQKLSTLNQAREKLGFSLYDERGNLTRQRIELPLDYEEIKAALKDVLVYHKPEQRLISSRINKTKKRKTDENNARVNIQKTYAVRGSLHKDTFFGKLKNPTNQGFEKEDVFVSRIELNGENFNDEKSLDKIVDRNIRTILKQRLSKYKGKGENAFSEEALSLDPVYIYSLKDYPNGLPLNPTSKQGSLLPTIKKVRVVNKNSRNLIQLTAKDEEKNIINENRYAEADGNYLMALYEFKEKDKKGKEKVKRGFQLVSFFDAVNKRRQNIKLFEDELQQKDGTFLPLMKNCPFLKQGDFVILYENNENEIDWQNKLDLKRRLFKISELGFNPTGEGYGVIKLIIHNKSKNKGDKYLKSGNFLKKSETLNAIKVRLTPTGEIQRLYE